MMFDMKKMICCFGLLTLMFGCKKSFLDVPPQGESVNFDTATVQSLVTGAYSALVTPDPGFSGFPQYDIHGVYFITVTNIMSDDADKGSYAQDQPPAADIDNFTLTSTNTYVEGLWKGYYAGIQRTNAAIASLNADVSFFGATRVAEEVAEMRFLRGYLYFNLVRMFGGVPIVLSTATGFTNQLPTFNNRATATAVYDSIIIPDLQYATQNLPLKTQTDVGRATKGAAETLLAKVDIYLKNWQQCDSLTNDVINSGQYQLVPDYSILWKQAGDNSAESIFEVQTGLYANTDHGIPEYVEFQGARQDNGMGTPTTAWNNPGFNQPSGDDGFGFCAPTANLIAEYEPGDLRLAATIIQLPAGAPPDTLWDGFTIPTLQNTTVNYNYKAYHSERPDQKYESFLTDRSQCQKNVHLLRFAEVYLLKAEADYQLGESGNAVSLLNMVRARAGLAGTTAAGGTDLQTAIWHERRVELAMEHDRFWDLVRQGRAASVMIASGKSNFVAGKNELLPIPFAEIQASNGSLSQNPGY
jgi:starch-binding outer membrane protein, SusD/RagB family